MILLAILLLLVLAAAGWWLSLLVEALRTPDSQWAAADQNKLVFVVVLVVVPLVGALVYVLVARPALRSATPAVV